MHALLIGLAGCDAGGIAAPSSADASVSAEGIEPARPSETADPLADLNLPPTPSPAPSPHAGVITVVDVAQARSVEAGRRVFAIRLKGDIGLSAIYRTLEIQARMESIDGSSCEIPPVPTVLRPSHADAVQPTLADQTRTVIVGPMGDAGPGAGSGSAARFRTGPVPSLNGDFSGWVSFHFPANAERGFCAFDVSGAVIIVAGETTIAELPVTRVDTRLRLDGR